MNTAARRHRAARQRFAANLRECATTELQRANTTPAPTDRRSVRVALGVFRRAIRRELQRRGIAI